MKSIFRYFIPVKRGERSSEKKGMNHHKFLNTLISNWCTQREKTWVIKTF